jgi:hypothetical protein
MAKVIKDTKQISAYSEDYRCGGWTTRTVEAFYCSNCNKELLTVGKFCPHCGEPLKGMRNKIEERRRKAARPYEEAYGQLLEFRNTLEKDSIAWTYITKAMTNLTMKISNID